MARTKPLRLLIGVLVIVYFLKISAAVIPETNSSSCMPQSLTTRFYNYFQIQAISLRALSGEVGQEDMAVIEY